MDDISRELEKEIERAKPKPYKQDRKTRLIIVDDFGKMKSGDYLKTFVKFLFLISIVCFSATVIFYYFYTNLLKSSGAMKNRLDIAENRVDKLTREKEVLMAKLVIFGDKLDIDKIVQATPVDQKLDTNSVSSESASTKIQPVATKDEKQVAASSENKKQDIEPKIEKNIKTAESITSEKLEKKINKTVTIENFIVKKSKSNTDLLVRFDIRKIAKIKNDVSGRIFIVLRPDNAPEDRYLVVPTTSLNNGIPSDYNKGQYFSISNFKPVKFRINNQSNPDLFKTASIFIFNEQKDLIFQKIVNITEEQ